MKKGTIKALTILAIPVVYVLVKQGMKTTIPMTATDITRGENKTKIKVESEDYYKTISIPNDSLVLADLPDMYFLTKDNINYRSCQKIQATKINMNTEEMWIEKVYYDIYAEEFVTDYKNYTILTSEEFKALYGIDKLETSKPSIVK